MFKFIHSIIYDKIINLIVMGIKKTLEGYGARLDKDVLKGLKNNKGSIP